MADYFNQLSCSSSGSGSGSDSGSSSSSNHSGSSKTGLYVAAVAACTAGTGVSFNQCRRINIEGEMADAAVVYQTLQDHDKGCEYTSFLAHSMS